MGGDLETGHGMPEELTVEPAARPMRPLTADEKLAATRIAVDTRAAASTTEQLSDNEYDQQDNKGILAKLRELEVILDRKLAIESDGIERKLPGDRERVSWRSQLTIPMLWASATLNLTTFSIGFLARMHLDIPLKQSIILSVIGSLLGAAASAFCATFGAVTGLRQMSVGRYSIGWYPSKIVAAVNVILRIGWSAAGCIMGGMTLSAVSKNRVPIEVGIIVISSVSLLISFAGLRAILIYESYAWAVYLVIFVIVLGEAGRYANIPEHSVRSGATLTGHILSLLAIAYGASASWTIVASDYNVQYAEEISRIRVFLLTWLGIAIPTGVGMAAGCVTSAATTNNILWYQVYRDKGLGSLLRVLLYPQGFGDFLLVMLVLSVINVNIINTYSAALSCQQIARPLARIPRFLWTVICFFAVIVLSLAGRGAILNGLQDLLSLLSYWVTSYVTILLIEHFAFRRGSFSQYDLDGWDTPSSLPLGLAGSGAFALGIVAWVLGMRNAWFIGPLAKLVGPYGGDIANELTFAITSVAYLPLRYLELRHFGR